MFLSILEWWYTQGVCCRPSFPVSTQAKPRGMYSLKAVDAMATTSRSTLLNYSREFIACCAFVAAH